MEQDRDYGSAVFKNAFVGKEAVDWMLARDVAGSRAEAVAIGQRLVEFGLVEHANSAYRSVRNASHFLRRVKY